MVGGRGGADGSQKWEDKMRFGVPKHSVGEPGGSHSPPVRVGGLSSDLLTTGRWRWLHQVLFVLLFVLPMLALMVVSIDHYRQDSTLSVLEAKKRQGLLAATVINEKLNAKLDLGLSFVTRPLLVQNIERGRWQDAMRILNGVRELYPEIDRIVLYDVDAIIKADMPVAGVVGESRAFKVWFKEFSRHGKAFLSGVYMREAEPKAYVVSLVLPVRTLSTLGGGRAWCGKLVGILQVQLSLRGFYDWTRVDVGRRGLIYVFDQYGHLVHHSRQKGFAGIVDFSSVGIVRKALAGYSGAELGYDPIEGGNSVVAYQPLLSYQWGLVVAEAAAEAFAERDHSLQNYYLTYATLAFMALLLSLALLRILVLQKVTADRQRELALLDELTGLNNRRGFMTLSTQQIGTAARLQQRLFFIYADLNDMKLINDRLGHKEGDRALVDTAQILRSAFRDIDIKARIGGDEFVVLGTLRDGFDADIVKARLLKATLTYQEENPRPYQLSFCTGVVFYDPQTPCSLEDLMEHGDRLMYELKAARHRTPPDAIAV